MNRIITVLGLLFCVFSFSFADIIFKPEKYIYKKGENICFYIKNSTNKTIFLPSSAPWAIFKNDKFEKIIYAPVATQQIVKLKPNKQKKWCWKQKDYQNNDVVSGEYAIRLTLFENGKRKFLSFKVKINPEFSNAK